MSFRIEVEVVEADHLPLSHRGGKPDPFVFMTIPSRKIKQRTATLSSTQTPMWGQKIIVTACSNVEELVFNMFDRDDTPMNFIGKAVIEVGGPSRSVGSRWLQLDGKNTRLRIVWEISLETGDDLEGVRVTAADAIAATKKDPALRMHEAGKPKEVVASGSSIGEVQQSSISHEKNETSQQNTSQDPQLEQKFYAMMNKYDSKFADIERRLLDIETVLCGQKTIEKSAVRASNSATHRHMDVGTIISTQAAASQVRSTAEQVIEVRKELEQDSKSALASILDNPTRVTAEEEQLMANYHFHSVKLPKVAAASDSDAPRQGAVSPGSGDSQDAYIRQLLASANPPTNAPKSAHINSLRASTSDGPHLAGHPSALERKLDAATMSLSHSSRMMTSTTH